MIEAVNTVPSPAPEPEPKPEPTVEPVPGNGAVGTYEIHPPWNPDTGVATPPETGVITKEGEYIPNI